MHSYQLYHSDEIKKLKQELHVYKTVLSTIDNQHIVEEVMKITRQNELLTEELLKIKGDIQKMNKNIDQQLTDSEKVESDMTSHIQTMDTSFLELKQNVSKMMEKLDSLHLTELLEKINNIIDQQDKEIHKMNKLEEMRAEMVDLKKQLEEKEDSPTEEQIPPKTSEFRRLQTMLQSQDLLQSSNRNEPNRHQSMMNQAISNQNRQMTTVNTSTRKSFSVPNIQRTYTHPHGVNKNIITRIKPAQYNTHPIEKNTVSVKKVSSSHKPPEEKVVENKQPLHEKQETLLSTNTSSLSHSSDVQEHSENHATKANNIVHDHQEEVSKKQEKASFLSIFRRN